jgi:hypothetical protein
VYLSAERTALINQTIMRTFEQSSIAWQAIPHWDTCDPGQFRVRPDILASTATSKDGKLYLPIGGQSIELVGCNIRFLVSLAQATAPTPDSLLASVIARTVDLATGFDTTVLDALKKLPEGIDPVALAGGSSAKADGVLDVLLGSRQKLEDAGYRADSCFIASTAHYQAINQLVDGLLIAEGLLSAANINSLYRSAQLNDAAKPDKSGYSLMVGRRREIAHRGAPEASPGEEPVDIAVSVPPSLEVVGDLVGDIVGENGPVNVSGQIELGVRIRFALRMKDNGGVVVLRTPSSR